ncbi:MAG TPA: MFS transporter [Acidobacteriota bacterium]|jgi:ACS family hexuronate transporter-like MFS transporter
MPKTIKHLRWYIGALLFLSTVINYIDRQTLSVLAPYLKTEYHWNNQDYRWIVISFRIAYAIGQSAGGRFLDWLGTRRGLSITVAFYSLVAMLTSLAGGLRSFCFFRFFLGSGEAANWPGATKAVSEWFPRRESGWAVALFDSGSSIGGALAPLLVLSIYHQFNSWRPAFIITGTLGFLWLMIFRLLYHSPEDHPRISKEERDYILADRAATATVGERESEGAKKGESGGAAKFETRNSKLETPNLSTTPPLSRSPALPLLPSERLSYKKLLSLPQTWGYIIGKTLTDPVWFFITDWFAIYLVSKGFKMEESLFAFWVPFLAADIGNFFGGGLSSYLINRGWSVGWARKTVVIICGIGMTLLIPTVFTSSLYWLVACFAVSTLAYAAFSTMVLNLPADIFPTHSVASVSGMGGTGAGIGTIIATYLIGAVADRYSFAPILVVASVIPLVAMLSVLILVRNNEATEAGIVKRI